MTYKRGREVILPFPRKMLQDSLLSTVFVRKNIALLHLAYAG